MSGPNFFNTAPAPIKKILAEQIKKAEQAAAENLMRGMISALQKSTAKVSAQHNNVFSLFPTSKKPTGITNATPPSPRHQK